MPVEREMTDEELREEAGDLDEVITEVASLKLEAEKVMKEVAEMTGVKGAGESTFINELVDDGEIKQTCPACVGLRVFRKGCDKRTFVERVSDDGIMVSPNSRWKVGPHDPATLYDTLQAAQFEG